MTFLQWVGNNAECWAVDFKNRLSFNFLGVYVKSNLGLSWVSYAFQIAERKNNANLLQSAITPKPSTINVMHLYLSHYNETCQGVGYIRQQRNSQFSKRDVLQAKK